MPPEAKAIFLHRRWEFVNRKKKKKVKNYYQIVAS